MHISSLAKVYRRCVLTVKATRVVFGRTRRIRLRDGRTRGGSRSWGRCLVVVFGFDHGGQGLRRVVDENRWGETRVELINKRRGIVECRVMTGDGAVVEPVTRFEVASHHNDVAVDVGAVLAVTGGSEIEIDVSRAHVGGGKRVDDCGRLGAPVHNALEAPEHGHGVSAADEVDMTAPRDVVPQLDGHVPRLHVVVLGKVPDQNLLCWLRLCAEWANKW